MESSFQQYISTPINRGISLQEAMIAIQIQPWGINDMVEIKIIQE